MTDLYGPEAMKLGETYKVVNGKKGLRLEKIEPRNHETKLRKEEYFDVEFQLSPIRFYMACIQGSKVGLSFDQWIAKTIEELLDQIYNDGPSKY